MPHGKHPTVSKIDTSIISQSSRPHGDQNYGKYFSAQVQHTFNRSCQISQNTMRSDAHNAVMRRAYALTDPSPTHNAAMSNPPSSKHGRGRERPAAIARTTRHHAGDAETLRSRMEHFVRPHRLLLDGSTDECSIRWHSRARQSC